MEFVRSYRIRHEFKDHPEHQERNETVKRQNQVPCQYFCEDTLQKLGLYGEVMEYVRTMKLEKFMRIHDHVYWELTEEFLSSFELYTSASGKPLRLTFQLFGEYQEISYHEVLDLFGFDRDGISRVGSEFDRVQAWAELTYDEEPFIAGRAKASQLKSFAHRYINQWLNMTIFGTSEHGKLRVDTLASLHYAKEGKSFNFGRAFCEHLAAVAMGDYHSLIAVGGMITHLVVNLFDL